MADLPTNSPDKVRALKALPYQEYLATAWWRLRRHARLKKAGGKCERCGRVTTFQDVHHVYYTRLGEERDSDLEVVCRDCHNKHHVDESRRQHTGQYELVARETLRLDRPPSYDDFKDAFLKRCNELHLPIDHRFHDTVTIVWDKKQVALASAARRQELDAMVKRDGPQLPPIGKQEAVELCRRLGLKFPLKHMPTMAGMGMGVAATRARAAARLKAERCPNCQRQGAQLSGVQLGDLWCSGCDHRWSLSAAHLI